MNSSCDFGPGRPGAFHASCSAIATSISASSTCSADTRSAGPSACGTRAPEPRQQRDQASIDAEAATDGIYVIRTPVSPDVLDAGGTVAAHKGLSRLERDFRSIKADDLDLRPIFHRLQDRVRAHVLICMLACYLTWHLRQAWARLTHADEHPPQRVNPVAPPAGPHQPAPSRP